MFALVFNWTRFLNFKDSMGENESLHNLNIWYLFHYLCELQMSTEVTLGDFMGKSTVLVSQN